MVSKFHIVDNRQQKIKNCLISVSDKNNIIDLAKFLIANNINILSTGGTYKLLKENNITTTEIAEFTSFPEIMDGRVKTLHPKIHGGLLGINSCEEHLRQAEENGIISIDLIIVNLYPFSEVLTRIANSGNIKPDDNYEIIENIDIGGPAMVRSAAKNFAFKTVITSPKQYDILKKELKDNNFATNFEFRLTLANQALRMIADYDLAIANWFDKYQNDVINNHKEVGNLSNDIEKYDIENDLENEISINLTKKYSLRYGENSHQKAGFYIGNHQSPYGIAELQQIGGKELSYNNLNDIDSAYNLICEFKEPAAVIIKHNNPCGVAIADNIKIAYQKALLADSKSAFGGIIAFNKALVEPFDNELANLLSQMFFEVIIAPDFSPLAIAILGKKKNLRLIKLPFNESKKTSQLQYKSIAGGFLVQEQDCYQFSIDDLKLVSNNNLNHRELEELLFALTICKHIKSNAIAVVSNFQTIGLGIGQTNRVDSCKIATKKALELISLPEYKIINPNINKLFLASDAFFPFADNIEIAAEAGISGIVATSGSIRDNEVIAKANEKNIPLYFIKTRHFKH